MIVDQIQTASEVFADSAMRVAATLPARDKAAGKTSQSPSGSGIERQLARDSASTIRVRRRALSCWRAGGRVIIATFRIAGARRWLRQRALVIGGSVGGLFAAHLLRAAGWEVAVFERAAGDLGDRGTGIGTRTELFAVMRRIGLAADASLGDRGARAASASTGRRRHSRTAGAARSPAPGRASGGRCGRRCRTRCYAGGKTLTRIEPHAGGVTAIFDDGRAPRAICWSPPTDCIRRCGRSSFPELAPRYAGYVAWRGVVEAA